METQSARFSSPEQPEEVVGYRRMSSLAVIALIVAVVSAVSLIHPLLWVVPAAAFVLALSALRQIGRSPELAGRNVALSALILALVLGSWSVSWVLTRQAMITRQAREHAERWFDLVREGKLREAHQLTKPAFERAPDGESLSEFYARETVKTPPSLADDPEMMVLSPQQELDQFFAEPPLANLVALGSDFDFEFQQNESLTRVDAQLTLLQQRFKVRFQQDGKPREVELEIQLQRNVNNGRAQWHVGKIQRPDDAA